MGERVTLPYTAQGRGVEKPKYTPCFPCRGFLCHIVRNCDFDNGVLLPGVGATDPPTEKRMTNPC